MRLAELSQRELHVYWLARTGRAAMDYQGEENVVFADLFGDNIDGLASVSYVPEPPQMPSSAAGLDYSGGFELPVGKGIQVPPEVVMQLTSPRILDMNDPAVRSAEEVWIHLSTMPVGGADGRHDALANAGDDCLLGGTADELVEVGPHGHASTHLELDAVLGDRIE